MIIEISPIRATALNQAIGRDCIAYLTFKNWGQVATNYVCLVYQLSADGLSTAIDTYIDLSDLDADIITSKMCTSTNPPPPLEFSTVPTDGSCMVVSGNPIEEDTLLAVEVYCYNGNLNEPPKKYLGIYEMNASYRLRPFIRIPEIYASDRSLNPGFVDIDPAASVLARGIFDSITATLRLDDNSLIPNLPVSVSVSRHSLHTVSLIFDISVGNIYADRKIVDIMFYHPDYGTIGRITNLLLPMSSRITYIADINTQIAV